MDKERKKLEAIGDGLLLACARLYLHDRHRDVSYDLWTRLITKMVSNKTLTMIAQAEGIRGEADGFEVEIGDRYYRRGFRNTKHWLWSLFDKHLDITEEVRKILHPEPADKLTLQVEGALRHVMKNAGGQINGNHIERAAKQIVANLRNGSSL